MACNGTKLFNVIFSVRQGFSHNWEDKIVQVILDDIPCDWSEKQMREQAVRDAETTMLHSDDYKLYGRNWKFKTVEDA